MVAETGREVGETDVGAVPVANADNALVEKPGFVLLEKNGIVPVEETDAVPGELAVATQ